MLPGGFQLPLAICVETWIPYETEEADLSAVQEKLSDFSRQYLLQQMCAGSIFFAEEALEQLDGIVLLQGSYSCLEMIGITRLEENMLNYVEND